jgi:hypothetical protein
VRLIHQHTEREAEERKQCPHRKGFLPPPAEAAKPASARAANAAPLRRLATEHARSDLAGALE